MGKVRGTLGMALAAGLGAATVIAYRVSRKTGKSLTEAYQEIPAEVLRYWEEFKGRAQEARQAGREAARRKEAEISQQLAGQDGAPGRRD